MTPDTNRIEAFLRALGDELLIARKKRGWTRRDLRDRLPSIVSSQTLATYETGTRHCPVNRLLELTDALETSLPDLISRALDRVGGALTAGLTINLTLAARTPEANLAPLRRWARSRITHTHTATSTTVTPAALAHLAELCGISTTELVDHLTTTGIGTTTEST